MLYHHIRSVAVQAACSRFPVRGVTVTQSDLVFNHLFHALQWGTRAAQLACNGLQQHDETPPEIAPKMAAGLTPKLKIPFAGGCGVNEACCLFKLN